MLDELDTAVRSVLRREGIDPQRDEARLRSVVEETVRAHDELSLTGAVAPVEDPEAATAELISRIGGFGPLQVHLNDPEVEEVWINAPDRVFVARAGRHALTTTILTRDEVRELVERMLKQSGRRLDVSSPFVDARLPQGHRLHVVLEGVSAGFAAVNIRKFLHRSSSLEDLVGLGSLTAPAADFLRAAVAAGLTVLVAGGTQAGKTTLLNCLAGAVPGHERIISAEEVRELRVPHPDWVALECRQAGFEGTGEITLRDLVREALRMRPTRLVVGEVRGAEALDLLVALNSGIPGMATVHANSARAALTKLCTLPMLAGENISSRFVVPTVAASIDVVVHLGQDQDRVRRVTEIATVSGRVEDDVIELEGLFVRDATGLRRTGGMPSRTDAFARAGIDVAAVLRGTGDEPGWVRS